MFVEGSASGWGPTELIGWFRAHASALGLSSTPAIVTDAGIGSIALQPGARVVGERVARVEHLPKLLAMTRLRVVFTLRGLLSQPADDRFLKGAIFSGRVRREKALWLAHPHEADLLSDIVLSLFAVDVLTYRDFHEQHLCICDVCGRVSFNPPSTTRAGCSDHVPKSAAANGPASGPASGPVSPRGLVADEQVRAN